MSSSSFSFPSSHVGLSRLSPSSSDLFPDLLVSLPLTDRLGRRSLSPLVENVGEEAVGDMNGISADPVTCYDVVAGKVRDVSELGGLSSHWLGLKVRVPSSLDIHVVREKVSEGESKGNEGGVGDEVAGRTESSGGGGDVHESGIDQAEAEEGNG